MDKKWLLRQVTDIFYKMDLDIESIHTENLTEWKVLDHFILRSDEEDYYIYDRLIERMKFDIPELVDSKLIRMY